jgi:hypothetical protein
MIMILVGITMLCSARQFNQLDKSTDLQDLLLDRHLFRHSNFVTFDLL